METTEKEPLVNRLLAGAVGLGSFVLMMVWSFPGVHPYAWTDMAVGGGLLPQGAMLPGLGAFVSAMIFKVTSFGTGMMLNVICAKLLMAYSAYLLFGALSRGMGLVAGFGARDWRRRQLAIRVSAFVGALAFVCSDPVWHAAQGLTASTIALFVTVLTVNRFGAFLETAKFGPAAGMLMSLGLLCAETPGGWLVFILEAVVTNRYVAQAKSDAWSEFLDPVVLQRTKWSLTFIFIGSFLLGVLAEVGSFAYLDGMRAAGVSYGELPIRYIEAYGSLVGSAMSFPGLCLFLLVAIVPFVISSILIGPATDEDRYLTFKLSLVYILVGAVAFLQLSPFEFTWFWSLLPGAVESRQIIVASALLSTMAFTWALYVLCVEIFCRDYEHIEQVMYQNFEENADDEGKGEREDVKSVHLTAGRLSMLIVPVLVVLVIVWGRRLPDDRALLQVVRDFIDETLQESQGVKYLFTDGSYDAALRLESHRRGIGLLPVSLMSGASRREAYVRQLGSTDFEDRMTLEAGAAEALRTWVTAKSERLTEVAVQIAFELFRLNRHLSPIVYGLLVRPSGGDAAVAAASVERCHLLADRIVALHENGSWRHAKDNFLKDRFLFAQFRLAVMSRLRAINFDAEKKVKESIAEIAYSDKLNACNPSLLKILKRLDWVRRQSGEALTPREGLEVAMKRADFNMARRYAMPVLKQDPDEPNANFAVGMSYYAEEQFAKAEDYLKRALKRMPKEPAIFNNLALICLKTGRLEEAEKNALEAQRLLPDSREVKDTVRQIEQAKTARKSPVRGKIGK